MKIRAGVFFGGKSVEHEVSVITAMQAIAAMDREKYDIIPVYLTKDNQLYTGPHLQNIEVFRNIPAALQQATRVELIRDGADVKLRRIPAKKWGSSDIAVLDVAVLAFHGACGEDGVMQGVFERLGLPYTGCDVTASAVGMDKWLMKGAFRMAGVPCLDAVKVPKTAFFQDMEGQMAAIEAAVSYPIIVKPYNLGSSVGIGLAKDRSSLQSALQEAFQYTPFVLCERAMQNLREINCSVLGDHEEAVASVCEEPLGASGFLTYADKYQGGGKGAKTGGKGGGMSSLSRAVPADLPEEVSAKIRQLAIAAFHAIGASGVSRIDFLLDSVSGDIFVNEINTIPGSLSFYLWEKSGLTFTQLMDQLVSLALKRQRERSRFEYSFDVNLLAGVSLGGAKGSKGGVKG